MEFTHSSICYLQNVYRVRNVQLKKERKREREMPENFLNEKGVASRCKVASLKERERRGVPSRALL